MRVEDQDNVVREVVHASDIQAGDTVEIDNIFHTVGSNNIKRGGFCGTSIFGMTYFPQTGYQKITRIKFAVPTANGIVLR
jgi:hypothetical protein